MDTESGASTGRIALEQQGGSCATCQPHVGDHSTEPRKPDGREQSCKSSGSGHTDAVQTPLEGSSYQGRVQRAVLLCPFMWQGTHCASCEKLTHLPTCDLCTFYLHSYLSVTYFKTCDGVTATQEIECVLWKKGTCHRKRSSCL